MQAREIRGLTKEEMEQRLEENRRRLFVLRRDLYMGRLEDFNRVGAVKRDIARLKTILRERELVEWVEEEAL
ncbi:MAG TPA: 50S ribosomal protein L29 [Chloroflexi bacterium]|nr:50S ribosomal protein L29 [Chloroflexota bacterium]